jgi:hypothetical protein
MDTSNCPSWLCNEWGVPHNYIFFLGFLLLNMPYFILWRFFYNKNKNKYDSTLDYCELALLTEVTLWAYSIIMFGLSKKLFSHSFSSFILSITYIANIYLIFSFFLTLIFIVVYSIFKKLKSKMKHF